MTTMSAGVSVLAHGVHYGVLGVGLLGLVALLGPRFAAPRRAPLSQHEQRVLALRQQLASGDSLTLTRPAPLRLVRATPAEGLLLPLAVVSSAAAAGVHAAVGPAHFREQTLFGLFFAGTAIVQILWAVAVVLHPSRRALLFGAVGNLAVVALWLLTRTYGLPGGLMPTPEAIGLWDVTCAVWEIAVAAACIALLRTSPQRLQLPRWFDWSSIARSWAVVSVGCLLLLTFSGASA